MAFKYGTIWQLVNFRRFEYQTSPLCLFVNGAKRKKFLFSVTFWEFLKYIQWGFKYRTSWVKMCLILKWFIVSIIMWIPHKKYVIQVMAWLGEQIISGHLNTGKLGHYSNDDLNNWPIVFFKIMAWIIEHYHTMHLNTRQLKVRYSRTWRLLTDHRGAYDLVLSLFYVMNVIICTVYYQIQIKS